ncbi:MAG: hypothetical protein FJ202_07495 [Gemmatimonadetes bacterium]|nr:hypothetical protein [Gemmatimonadota bacterium]
MLARVVVAACVVSVPAVMAAQRNPCTARHPRVDDVRIEGSRAVSSAALFPLLATERTSFWRRTFGWRRATLTCLDSADVVRDAALIADEHRDRGFLEATVEGRVERYGDRRARIRFRVSAGEPLAVSRVAAGGVPPRVLDSAALTRRLRGQALDDSVVYAVAESLHAVVRDAGYARAQPPTVQIRPDSGARRAYVEMTFRTGSVTAVSDINVAFVPTGRAPTLSAEAARSAFGIRPGDRFSGERIGLGQRDLNALDLYRQIRVDTAPAASASPDSIRLVLTLGEGDRRRARTTAGWGTLDCFRTQTRAVEQDFLGSGHRLELSARLSKIGLGEPFDALRSFCSPRVRDDAFSQNMNYYVGASLRLRGWATWRGLRLQPELTLFSERRSQVNAYEQTTEFGALATSTQSLRNRKTFGLQYAYTDSRTRADQAVSCTQFGFCRLEDLASFVLRSPLHAVSASLAKNPLLPTDDPRSGYRWSIETKFGHASVGQVLPIDYGRLLAEGAWYHALTPWLTLATRLQVGGIVAPADESFLLPPSERFYGGGQNTVRGFGQNLLGPGSYIVSRIDTVSGPGGAPVGAARPQDEYDRIAPSGGNAMWIGNIELRSTRGWPSDLLRWVLFVDMGRVWNTQNVFSVTNADTRATPGIGARVITPLGPFRVDIGYDPTSPEPGPAFYVIPASNGAVGRAVCVSPGSEDPITLRAGDTPFGGRCPASYLPTRPRSLLSRLTFHFSLGNAF